MTAVRFERAAVRDWAFPRAAAGVRLLVDHAREHGMAEPEVLAGSGLTADGLATATEVTAAQELRVVRNLRRRLGEVGDQVGRRYRATTFGVLGYALVSSHTLLDAMNVALRFLDLSHTFAIPSAAVDGERVRIVVSGADLPGDVRGFLVDRDAAAIRAVLREIGPEGVTTTSAREGDAVVVSLPVADLGRRLSRADSATRAVSEAVCHDVVARRRARPGLAGEVRVLLTQQLVSGAAMADVAAALGVTDRTLRRRLSAEGTSYQRLLDEVRESLALELLGTGRLRVQDVAVRLGYAEASSFILAFRRWTGRTPGGLR